MKGLAAYFADQLEGNLGRRVQLITSSFYFDGILQGVEKEPGSAYLENAVVKDASGNLVDGPIITSKELISLASVIAIRFLDG